MISIWPFMTLLYYSRCTNDSQSCEELRCREQASLSPPGGKYEAAESQPNFLVADVQV